MIYLHVTVQVHRGKMAEWTRIYKDHLLPAMEKHGQRLVAAWKTSVGMYDEVTDLYAFEDFTEFQNIREKLFNEPEVLNGCRLSTKSRGKRSPRSCHLWDMAK